MVVIFSAIKLFSNKSSKPKVNHCNSLQKLDFDGIQQLHQNNLLKQHYNEYALNLQTSLENSTFNMEKFNKGSVGYYEKFFSHNKTNSFNKSTSNWKIESKAIPARIPIFMTSSVLPTSTKNIKGIPSVTNVNPVRPRSAMNKSFLQEKNCAPSRINNN